MTPLPPSFIKRQGICLSGDGSEYCALSGSIFVVQVVEQAKKTWWQMRKLDAFLNQFRYASCRGLEG